MSSRFFVASLILATLVATFLPAGVPLPDAAAAMAVPGLGAPDKAKDRKTRDTVSVPQGLDRERVDGFVAQLSDEQVRRLLIEELRQAALAKPHESGSPQPDGFTRVIQITGEIATLFHNRIDELTSDARDAPAQLSGIYEKMAGSGSYTSIPSTLLFVVLLLMAAVFWTRAIHRRKAWEEKGEEENCELRLSERMRRQAMRAVRDGGAALAVAVLGVVLFFVLIDDHGAARMMFLTYTGLMLLVGAIYMVLNFILSPGAPALRLVSLGDDAAAFIHRWVMAVALVIGLGLLVTVTMELLGIPERLFVMIDACTGMVVFLMVLYVMFVKRRPVSGFLAGLPSTESSKGSGSAVGRTELYWYLAAIAYLFACFLLWVFYLLVGRTDIVLPVFALLSGFPLFVALNRLGRKLLDTIFGFIESQEGAGTAVTVQTSGSEGAASHPSACGAGGPRSHFGRFIPVMRYCLSACIAGLVCFWVLYQWGFNVKIGETVMSAALEVLFVLTLSYVAWKLIEGAISRKLAQIEIAGPEADDERESAGEGGSRAGTLLHLLRKFLFVALVTMVVLIVLSAIGIDIAPLLAGAGILGLAIGFGTQTLVKDIVSGVFFLIDDAFRIGDYVDTGKLKGTVEHISIRSLQLRHTRGMVHTIPFSDLKSVTNYSRDYNIEKIDIRVPFDTDVDQVRKVVKKINKELAEDVELGGKLLEPIKSQGVREVDDSAMIIRIKFKTRPGDQYAIKREMFTKIKRMFEEKGIRFAHRHVVVRLPEEMPHRGSDGQDDGRPEASISPEERLVTSGAAAALASVLAEEEAKKRREEEEKNKS